MIAGLVLLAGGAAAGMFGSLLGLGGGILIVPLLSLGMGLPLREAAAISLVSVIVTSSAAAAVYLEAHTANLRLGMTLELFSAAGAFAGGLVAFLIDEQILAGLFAILMIWVAISMVRRKDTPGARTGDAVARTAAVEPATTAAVEPVLVPVPTPPDRRTTDPGPAARPVSFIASLGGPGYTVHALPLGMLGSVFAGLNSALLGVGGGMIKVPVMHLLMGAPLRVSTATSNMMMGITATASTVIYLLRDVIDPFVAGPIVLGVFVGASAGSRIAHRVNARLLRLLFVVVLVYTAYEMIRRALGL